MASRSVCVTDVFDNGPITPLQVRVYILCLSIVLFDGFDLVVISVALPKIAQFLHAGTGALGLAVGAGQLGPLVGAMVLGMLSDRLGRKRMLIFSSLVFGVFTILIATIGSVEQLALYRFLSGIGLGGAVPNALSFGCEYAPGNRRASFTTMMWSGMPLGSVIAGLVAVWLLPIYGWQSLFLVGGIFPLAITAVVGPFLPESLVFLARQGTNKQRILKIISKIAPNMAVDKDTEFYIKEKKLAGVPVKHLFSEGRAFTTIAIWLLFFLSFYLLWVLLSWTPTLLRRSGATVQQYSFAFALLNLGSLVTALVIGHLMDRFNAYRVLIITFLIAFVAVSLFGMTANSPFIVIALMTTFTGLFVNGGNTGLMALCTISYPVSIRGSGVGWAYGVGKVGSMLGPVAGGFLLALNWSVGRICVVNGFAAVIVAGIVFILMRHADSVRLNAGPETASAASGK